MTLDEILATLPSGQIDDPGFVAACVQVFDEAGSVGHLRAIGRHIAAESPSEADLRMLRRCYGWRMAELREEQARKDRKVWRECLLRAAWRGQSVQWAMWRFERETGRCAKFKECFAPQAKPQEVLPWVRKVVASKE